jgi:hypothetical protein
MRRVLVCARQKSRALPNSHTLCGWLVSGQVRRERSSTLRWENEKKASGMFVYFCFSLSFGPQTKKNKKKRRRRLFLYVYIHSVEQQGSN